MARGTKRSRSGKALKKIAKRKLRRGRRGAMMGQNAIHVFKGTVSKLSVVRTSAQPGGLVVLGQQLQFFANEIGNWTNLSTLFDCYRIKRVTCKFLPNSTGMQNTVVLDPATGYVSTVAVDVGTIATAIDYNGNSSFSGAFGTLMEYDNCQMNLANKVFTRSFKPKPAVNMLSGATANATAEGSGKQWISTAFGDVPHNSLLVGARPGGNQASPVQNSMGNTTTSNLSFIEYDVYITYEIEFKNVR